MLFEFEKNFLLWIQENVRAKWATPIWNFITHLGDKGIIWIILIIILFTMTKTRKTSIKSIIGLLVSLLICNLILKNLVARTRPYDAIEQLTYLLNKKPHDYSFPSGHTCSSFVAAVTMYKGLPKKVGIPILILAGLIAFSRLYMGVHYLTDVLGGMIIGTIIANLVILVWQKVEDKLSKSKDNTI